MQGLKISERFLHVNNDGSTQDDIKNYCECSLKELSKASPDNQDS